MMARRPSTLAPSLCLIAVLLAVATGCITFASGVEPPEIGPRMAQVAEADARIEAMQQALARDLAVIDERIDAFVAVPPARYRPPFPLDIFRHAAMACLNQSDRDTASEVELLDEEALALLEATELRCRHLALVALLQRLRQASPSDREVAMAQLQRIDDIRALRGRLRRRAANLEELLRHYSGELASWRAEQRRLRGEVEQRRADYTDENLARTRQRLAALDEALEDHRRAIAALESTRLGLPDELREAIRRITLAITALRATAPVGHSRAVVSRPQPLCDLHHEVFPWLVIPSPPGPSSWSSSASAGVF